MLLYPQGGFPNAAPNETQDAVDFGTRDSRAILFIVHSTHVCVYLLIRSSDLRGGGRQRRGERGRTRLRGSRGKVNSACDSCERTWRKLCRLATVGAYRPAVDPAKRSRRLTMWILPIKTSTLRQVRRSHLSSPLSSAFSLSRETRFGPRTFSVLSFINDISARARNHITTHLNFLIYI